MDLKAFQLLDYISNRLTNIEKNIQRIDEKLEMSLAISTQPFNQSKKW